MDAGTLTQYVTADYTALATVSGVPDRSSFFARVVDQAYAALGLDAMDATVTLSTQQASDAPLLADYYALKSICRQLAGAVDQSSGNSTKIAYSQAFAHAQEMLAQASAIIASRGYGETQDFSYGRLNVDYIEPFYAPGVSSHIQ